MIHSHALGSATVFPRVDLDLTIERPCVDICDVVLSTSFEATLQLMILFMNYCTFCCHTIGLDYAEITQDGQLLTSFRFNTKSDEVGSCRSCVAHCNQRNDHPVR